MNGDKQKMTEDLNNQGRKLSTLNLPRIERRTNTTHTIPVLLVSINSQLTYYGKFGVISLVVDCSHSLKRSVHK